MSHLASPLVFMALAAATMAPAPRIELTRVELHEPAIAGETAHRIAEIRLTLINEGPKPVEVLPYSPVVPMLIGPDGKAVVFDDWRNAAGVARPTLPHPPGAPVRTGQRHQLQRYTIVRTAQGYTFGGPYGRADLLPGHYRVEVAFDLGPVTRQLWVDQYIAALNRPGQSEADRQQEAEHAADRFASHWQKVADYFSGHLAAPPLELTLP